ncbi:type II secretion system F family protein [Clostridiales bacterium COT073_COT-073]|nr:type II secretion system F family protein [Clostridiales bacterium COT073_COT-073]
MKASKGKLGKSERILFSRQLALALNSDISITEGLDIIRSKSEDALLVKALEEMVAKIYMGYSFGDAIKEQEEVFSTFYVNMVTIGEESGNLAEILEQVAQTYERDVVTVKKVKQAVTYPLILTCLMFGVIILLITEVMPMFDRVLKSLGGDIPAVTKVILKTGLFLKSYGWVILLVLLLIGVAISYYKKTEKGKVLFDKMKFFIPYQKDLTASLLAARFARNLGLLLTSGMSANRALEMIYPIIDNEYLAERIKASISQVAEGKGLDEVIETLNLFPNLLIKLFSVGVATGQMDHALLRAADEMDRDVDDKLTRLTSVLEPLLIVILSVIVGVILISVVLPVISIMNNIG